MQFNVAFFVPPGYPGVQAFDEIGYTIQCALGRLGHDVIVSRNSFYATRINILFGGHLLGLHHHAQLPARTIIYNTEQLGSGAAVIRPHYRALLAMRPVWDYSPANLEWLAREVPGACGVHAPISHVPELRRIARAPVEDIDVIFYGEMNDRRERILQGLVSAGIDVTTVMNCFGPQRDALIARSKLVLNLHAHETRIFEIVRVSYLLANARCVVSELYADTAIEPGLREAVAGAPADRLAETIRALLEDADARRALGERGQRIFSARDAVAMLRTCLAATPIA